jgi:hypothetical protein
MRIKLFVGTVIQNSHQGVYKNSVYANGRCLHMPVKTVDTSPLMITDHRLVLLAVAAFLSINTTSGLTIDIYTENDSVAFEWMHEYAEDHKFSHQTADRDLWEWIADKVTGQNVKLIFHDSTSTLTGIPCIERKTL